MKIVPTKATIKVTVDSEEVEWVHETVNEFKYDLFSTEGISGIVADIRTPETDTTIKSLELYLNDILTQIVVVEDYVKIMVRIF